MKVIVKITAVEASTDKIKIIKLVRALTGSGLKEAKDFVELRLPFSTRKLDDGGWNFQIQRDNYFLMEADANALVDMAVAFANSCGYSVQGSIQTYRIERIIDPIVYRVEKH